MPRGRPLGSKDSVRRLRRGKEPRTASTTLRGLFLALDASGLSASELAEEMRTSRENLWSYRSGRTQPGIMTVEEMAAALGYEIRLVKKEKEDV